jgi:hypothetical protein
MSAVLNFVDPWLSQLARIIPRVGRYLLLGVVVTILGSSTIGCEYFPESTFQLARESRLPKWIALPSGVARADVSITMSYYNVPWGGRAVFLLQDAKGKTLEKVYGKEKCRYPFYPKDPPPGFPPGYPAYQEVIVNDTTELIEHRKMEPVFYITDDPTVWKEYRAIGCR